MVNLVPHIALPPAGGNGLPLVLVVEDDEGMNSALCQFLSAEYATESAFDGEEGLAKALALRPDLILSDMSMPLGSGEELVEAVRANRLLDSTPIVLVSANTDGVLRARMLRAGAQDYVFKPVAAEELRARVANLVNAKRARDVLQRELDNQTPNLEALAQQLAMQKRQLATALEATRVARDLAEAASQLKSSFLSLVSHELHTPMASLLLQVQTLRRFHELPLLQQQRCLRNVDASTRRLAGLVDALLEYAGLASGRLEVTLEWLDLQALVAAVVSGLQPQALEKGLELRLGPSLELPLLLSDARLLRLITTNLLDNAIKFTDQGSVEISVSAVKGRQALRITDTGPGIALQDRQRIFEPFEHLVDLKHKHHSGLGLGLALVRQLTLALGGEVSVESGPGGGSTFEVRMP